MCPHSLSNLSLGKTGLMTGFQQGVKKLSFLTFDAFHFGADTGAAHQHLDNLVMGFHVLPPSSGRLQGSSRFVGFSVISL